MGKEKIFITSNIKEFISTYRREILFELLMVILLAVILWSLRIPAISIVDGSLVAVMLALPISVYNWLSGKKEKFFNDNIELLIRINEEQTANDNLINLRMMQVNYIYENRIKSANKEELEKRIVNTVSNLALKDFESYKDITRDNINKIYLRLSIEDGAKSKFKMINELFIDGDNILEKIVNDEKLHFYMNCNVSASEVEKFIKFVDDASKNPCLIVSSKFVLDDISKLDNVQYLNIFDSSIEYKEKDDEKEIAKMLKDNSTDIDSLRDILKKFDDNGNKLLGAFETIHDEGTEEQMETEQMEDCGIKAYIEWKEDLSIGERGEFKRKITKEKDNFIKFSRSYSAAEESNVRGGWFAIPKDNYEKIIGKYKYFYFAINSNPDIKGQKGGAYLRFDAENLKKLIDKKEGDSFATNIDRNGNKIYQFYLNYEKGINFAREYRVKAGKLPIKITKENP